MYKKLCTLTNQNTIRDLFDPFRGGYIQYFDLIFGNSLIHFGTAYVLFNTFRDCYIFGTACVLFRSRYKGRLILLSQMTCS